MLGDCDNFELPSGELPVFHANHRGTDALMMEFVRVLLSDGTYLECPVNVMLDNSDSMALQCQRPGAGEDK